MRKCSACQGLSPLTQLSCLHCGAAIAVRRKTGAVVALIAAASILACERHPPMAVYGGPPQDCSTLGQDGKPRPGCVAPTPMARPQTDADGGTH